MNETFVNVYVMRHGQKQSDMPHDLATLTETGRKQVVDSATNNLAGINFDGLYCSLKFRALETVVCAVSVLPKRNNGRSVIAKDDFDFSSMPDQDIFNDLANKVANLAKERNRQITVALWEEVAPAMIDHQKEKMQNGIIGAAFDTRYWAARRGNDRDRLHVLVGCHSPSSELATLDPEKTPMLREADIMHYVVVLEGREAKIVGSKYIDRGF